MSGTAAEVAPGSTRCPGGADPAVVVAGLRGRLLGGRVEAVLVDLDGTLYPSTAGIERQVKAGILRHAADLLGLAPAEAAARLSEYRDAYQPRVMGSVLGLQRHHGVDPASFLARVYREIRLDRVTARAGVAAGLSALAAHCAVYLTTNSSQVHARRLMRLLQVDGAVRRAYSIEDYGFHLKPHPVAFHRLLSGVGAPPERVVMFDDSYPNLTEAKRHGLTTVLVSNGVAEPPWFWEMHRRERHLVPPCADLGTHHLGELLRALTAAVPRDERSRA